MLRNWALLPCLAFGVFHLVLAGQPAKGVADGHPDLPGLLALKASICGSNCSALSSWRRFPGDVCESFDGVYCGVVDDIWRVVSIHLQLEKSEVLLNDSAMATAAASRTPALHVLPHLRELELLCYQSKLPEPGPVPANLHSLTASLPDYSSLQITLAGAAGPESLNTVSSMVSSSSSSDHLPTARILSSSTGSTSSSGAIGSHNQHSTAAAGDTRSSQAARPPFPAAAATGDLPPSWFRAFPHLHQLRVVACGATGRLPAELTAAPLLSSLVLSRNVLSGSLPEDLVLLQRLTVLDLSSNALTGTLPSRWAGLPLLSYLYLQNNNLTGELPCQWASLVNLRLADLSGNHWRAGALATCSDSPAADVDSGPADSPRRVSSSQPERPAATQAIGAAPAASRLRRSRTRSASGSSSSSGSSPALGNDGLNGGSAAAPRCWLRRFCYDEGVFLCLQRHSKAAGTAGCTSYLYGTSDLHVDASNQCDHGGVHLATMTCLWLALLTALLLIWLHHCRALRWMGQPAEALAHQWQQQQQFQQRQWLFTGPVSSPRAPGHAAAAAAAAAGGRLRVSPDQTLPLLTPMYRAAGNSEEGAGYERPASPGAGLMDRASSAGLPSALTTPPAATIVRILRRPSSNLGGGYGDGVGLDGGAAGGSSGQLQYQANDAPPPARMGRSFSSGSSSRAGGSQPLRTPSPLGGGGGGGSGHAEVNSCFNSALLLPLVFLLLDVTTDLRLLLLWGVELPVQTKLWPSYALLGLMTVPHLLVGAVVHFRLLAAACLPPALKAASPGLVQTDILPPGSTLVIRLYSALFASPCWLAYPLILLLLVPGVLLLSVLSPLTLLMHAVGLASQESVVHYVQLLQGCAALTEAPGVAVLLTVLFLMGNSPLEFAYLDGSLYYLTLISSFADMACAWFIRLEGVRRQRMLQLDVPPAGQWS